MLLSGTDVTKIPPHKRNLGFVFQQYALFPHLTVAQNIAYPLRMRRLDVQQSRTRVADAIRLIRLEGLEDRKPNQLSGGQQQRVALARAIVFRPPLLLMDEPMSALDKRLREEMQFEVRRLQRQLGITTIAVTHDQGEALVMSDAIIVLNKGKIEQIGKPDEVYRRPRSEFVANFIGESNLLEAGVERTGDETDACAWRTDDDPASQDSGRACWLTRYLSDTPGVHFGRPSSLPDRVAVNGRITEAIFTGEAIRITVDSALGNPVVAKVLSTLGRSAAGQETRSC